jgi:hypothetical protein
MGNDAVVTGESNGADVYLAGYGLNLVSEESAQQYQSSAEQKSAQVEWHSAFLVFVFVFIELG